MRFTHLFCLTVLLALATCTTSKDIALLATADVIAPESSLLVDFVKAIVIEEKDELSLPEKVPNSVLPFRKIYGIHTRIVIEGQPISTDVDGKMITGMWWARTPEQVKRDLNNAEEVFASVGIKFHIAEFVYKEYTSTAINHFVDASKYPDVLTIVYMLPKNFLFDGYSTGPWEEINRGIVIGYLANKWTLAHEIGHYFGLLHPFTNDLIDDTPEQEDKFCAGEIEATPNCGNIMNYCVHKPKFITIEQKERMVRFLRGKRAAHIVGDYEDILLRGQKFPVPPGLKITFNLTVDGESVIFDRENP